MSQRETCLFTTSEQAKPAELSCAMLSHHSQWGQDTNLVTFSHQPMAIG